jgi:hypothetical protein
MTEYTVEFHSIAAVWSFTVTADSKRDAAKQIVAKHLQSNDSTGIHVFVYKASESSPNKKVFNADNL